MFWPFVAITSIVGSAYLVRFAPQYSLAASYPGTFVFLLSVQLILFSAWSVIIYPKLFSPLRHLPTPSVGRNTRSSSALNVAKFSMFRVPLSSMANGLQFQGILRERRCKGG